MLNTVLVLLGIIWAVIVVVLVREARGWDEDFARLGGD